ncbi:arginyltransferase [Methyloligella sp. 2.7D]|uniref:arginyltransferase n=1 Tax=unclassified Methyloligella TaxID=2625955 RepID=UPI00157C3149|nr:arginyltransferase [Methyloligella sp. GL2]QKP77606.1 arginyltransferase [Methyloligella sp. GL2]
MTEHKSNFPEFYITAPQPCPYLAGRFERKLFTHLTPDKPDVLIDNLLKGGFRRSQNIAYMPYCDSCAACVPVRILVDEFQPSRSLKRIARSNRDLMMSRCNPVPNSEQYSLFRSYIDSRHADGGMAEMSVLDYSLMVEDSVVDTFLTEYRVKPDPEGDGETPLAAVCLCDRLSDGISMVYSFYDPEQNARSLGTYMILEHVEYARSLGLPYVYLGYWIEGSRKMRYKNRFHPQEHLTSKGWVRYDGTSPCEESGPCDGRPRKVAPAITDF